MEPEQKRWIWILSVALFLLLAYAVSLAIDRANGYVPQENLNRRDRLQSEGVMVAAVRERHRRPEG